MVMGWIILGLLVCTIIMALVLSGSNVNNKDLLERIFKILILVLFVAILVALFDPIIAIVLGVSFVLGLIAHIVTFEEKEIYQKYFKYFLIALVIMIPLTIWLMDKNSIILVIFLFFLILFWHYGQEILSWLKIKRHKKKK